MEKSWTWGYIENKFVNTNVQNYINFLFHIKYNKNNNFEPLPIKLEK